jgi:hypothetical protein
MKKKINLPLTQQQFDLIQSLLCEEGRRSRSDRERVEHHAFVTDTLCDMMDAQNESIKETF